MLIRATLFLLLSASMVHSEDAVAGVFGRVTMDDIATFDYVAAHDLVESAEYRQPEEDELGVDVSEGFINPGEIGDGCGLFRYCKEGLNCRAGRCFPERTDCLEEATADFRDSFDFKEWENQVWRTTELDLNDLRRAGYATNAEEFQLTDEYTRLTNAFLDQQAYVIPHLVRYQEAADACGATDNTTLGRAPTEEGTTTYIGLAVEFGFIADFALSLFWTLEGDNNEEPRAFIRTSFGVEIGAGASVGALIGFAFTGSDDDLEGSSVMIEADADALIFGLGLTTIRWLNGVCGLEFDFGPGLGFGAGFAYSITWPLDDGTPSTPPPTPPPASPSPSVSAVPSKAPTPQPSGSPSVSMQPSVDPSSAPSALPSLTPSEMPSKMPSQGPSTVPSTSPSQGPSMMPSLSNVPSTFPSQGPSMMPSLTPSEMPSKAPSQGPSTVPSTFPSQGPSMMPSLTPSEMPSKAPSQGPSTVPSTSPSQGPSVMPSLTPSEMPSKAPSEMPSTIPSTSPSQIPSMMPSVTCSITMTSFVVALESDGGVIELCFEDQVDATTAVDILVFVRGNVGAMNQVFDVRDENDDLIVVAGAGAANCDVDYQLTRISVPSTLFNSWLDDAEGKATFTLDASPAVSPGACPTPTDVYIVLSYM